MVKVTISTQVMSSVISIFKWFNIKVATVHHPVIQNGVDDLAKGGIELYTGGAGLYPNEFVILRCVDGLQPILSLKWFSCYMHMPTFKMLILRQVWKLSSEILYFISWAQGRLFAYSYCLLSSSFCILLA